MGGRRIDRFDEGILYAQPTDFAGFFKGKR